MCFPTYRTRVGTRAIGFPTGRGLIRAEADGYAVRAVARTKDSTGLPPPSFTELDPARACSSVLERLLRACLGTIRRYRRATPLPPLLWSPSRLQPRTGKPLFAYLLSLDIQDNYSYQELSDPQ